MIDPDDGIWRCVVCTAENTDDHQVCRVCRGDPFQGSYPERAPEDTPPPVPAWRVYPSLVVILITGMLFADLSPAATPWAAAITSEGRPSAVGANRADTLRSAGTDLLALTEELRSSTARGVRPSPTYNSRLGYVRSRWQLYGDIERFPRLHAQETALAAGFEDLSSLAFLAAENPLDPRVARGLMTLTNQLQQVEESLSYAP